LVWLAHKEKAMSYFKRVVDKLVIMGELLEFLETQTVVVDSDGVHVVVFWIAHCVYPWYCGSAIYLYTFLKGIFMCDSTDRLFLGCIRKKLKKRKAYGWRSN
jgi:hypothetical protein